MTPQTRYEVFTELFPKQPAFRWRQIETALFQPEIIDWAGVSTLPKEAREKLTVAAPFMSVQAERVLTGEGGEVVKALLKLEDDEQIESVLMKNSRGSWTVCISSQVGCAMACSFCATGKLGLKRNLTTDEIIDQVRFWQQYLHKQGEDAGRISNLVYMGMGEPLANYENVKVSLNIILAQTDIGPTRITVSTVGVLPRLEQILTDEDWPNVRLAISLHSVDSETRKKLMPSSYDDFLPRLQQWVKDYEKTLGNRRHHITFEYIMLAGQNDSEQDAQDLAKYVKDLNRIHVNLVPFNFVDQAYTQSREDVTERFAAALERRDIPVTIRRSLGTEIGAACGQLAKKEN